jgi:hypothetical protein
MSFHHSPKIVTDGLVLCLDAGNRKSYPRSGSIWNNLALRTANAELLNAPTFDNEKSGNFNFNGSSNIIGIQNSTNLDTQTPSIEVWFKTNNLNQNGFFFEKGTVNTQYSLFQEGETIVWRQNFGGLTSLNIATANFINTSNWYQIVATYISGSRRIYLNGTLIASDGQTGTISTSSGGMSIGVYGGYSGGRGYYYNGKIAIVNVYNRNLTSTEVLQNYNALKGRFNL